MLGRLHNHLPITTNNLKTSNEQPLSEAPLSLSIPKYASKTYFSLSKSKQNTWSFHRIRYICLHIVIPKSKKHYEDRSYFICTGSKAPG